MPKIVIVLTNGYADWECSFLNGIGQAYYNVETTKVTPNGDNVISMGGLKTIPDDALETIRPDAFDAMVLCGGTIWETADAPDTASLARSFLDADKTVAAICGGTLALARAGLLDDRRHTSNAAAFLTGNVDAYLGQSHYVDAVTAIDDRNVITAPGHAPARFSAAVFRAVGVDEPAVSEFLGMLSAEHSQT
ncbi:MAG: DJ-1/PfpI family protein [Alphaproteobacteria bacterium]|nr:DJ-1/PfpI family protein [Alphaproteobacteria bacterium]